MKLITWLPSAALALALVVSTASANDCGVIRCDASDHTAVCGSDGKTYQSECFLEFAKCGQKGLTLLFHRACEEVNVTESENVLRIHNKKTVDGGDGDSTDGDGDGGGDAEGLDDSVDAIEADSVEDDQAEANADAGERDDEHDYAERSESEEEAAEEAEEAEEEETEDSKECEKFCTREFEQVCASNGETYNNHCLFKNAQCHDKTLKIVMEDACPPPEEKKEEKKRSEENSEDEDKMHTVKLTVLTADAHTDSDAEDEADRKECNKFCTREFEPVCGSDGKTYDNSCLFEIGRCHNPELTKTLDDACP